MRTQNPEDLSYKRSDSPPAQDNYQCEDLQRAAPNPLRCSAGWLTICPEIGPERTGDVALGGLKLAATGSLRESLALCIGYLVLFHMG